MTSSSTSSPWKTSTRDTFLYTNNGDYNNDIGEHVRVVESDIGEHFRGGDKTYDFIHKTPIEINAGSSNRQKEAIKMMDEEKVMDDKEVMDDTPEVGAHKYIHIYIDIYIYIYIWQRRNPET